jgi:hypothetical protein
MVHFCGSAAMNGLKAFSGAFGTDNCAPGARACRVKVNTS